MIDRQSLLNAPGRLSDLHGDERRAALFSRKDRHDADWMRSRSVRPLPERIADAVRKAVGR
jgi:hypothetical protein